MSWKMEVRKDEPPPPGWYEAKCRKVKDTDTAFGMRLRWIFWLRNIGAEASGWTSMSPSTKARAYQWAQILNGGPIDPVQIPRVRLSEDVQDQEAQESPRKAR